MDNRFLSRGKCKNKKNMVEGYLIEQDDPEYHAYICMSGFKAEVDNRHQDILECDLEEIIPETAGRYTGLTDKNGKKIFEGDIVTGYFDHEKIIGYITYGSDATFFIQRAGLFGIGLNNATDWLTVIGNIHNNTEMLK